MLVLEASFCMCRCRVCGLFRSSLNFFARKYYNQLELPYIHHFTLKHFWVVLKCELTVYFHAVGFLCSITHIPISALPKSLKLLTRILFVLVLWYVSMENINSCKSISALLFWLCLCSLPLFVPFLLFFPFFPGPICFLCFALKQSMYVAK